MGRIIFDQNDSEMRVDYQVECGAMPLLNGGAGVDYSVNMDVQAMNELATVVARMNQMSVNSSPSAK